MYEKLKKSFDFVGIIDKTKYTDHLNHEILKDIRSIFVVLLAYPKVYLKQEEDKLLASIYTYGYDYHNVIKSLADEALKGEEYRVLVDNHNIDERKCLELTGLAYKGKNDLMINKELGSYFFIGLILTKKHYDEVITVNDDSCGTCEICINSCPVKALSKGFLIDKCMSAKNQLKEPFNDLMIEKNYLLLGCDICQRVCPKNKVAERNYHTDFLIKETAYVEVIDLFKLTNKEFKNKYGKHAYLWKGKTILLRNALGILLRRKNKKYNDLIEKTINSSKYPHWYKKDAKKILSMLKKV